MIFRISIGYSVDYRDFQKFALNFRKRGRYLKKYPKIVQCDARGQIVIPKDMRDELDIDEGTGFWMFSVTDEGILLKKINKPSLEKSAAMSAIKEKASKLGVNPKNLEKTQKKYKKPSRLEEL